MKYLFLSFFFITTFFSFSVSAAEQRILGPQIDVYYKYQRETFKLLFYTTRDYCARAVWVKFKDQELPLVWKSPKQGHTVNRSEETTQRSEMRIDENERAIGMNVQELFIEKRFFTEQIKKCTGATPIKEVCRISELLESKTATAEEKKEYQSLQWKSFDLAYACDIIKVRAQIKTALQNVETLKKKLERGEIGVDRFASTILGSSRELQQTVAANPSLQSVFQNFAVKNESQAISSLDPEAQKSIAELKENYAAEKSMRDEQQKTLSKLDLEIQKQEEKIQRYIIDGLKDSKDYDEALKMQSALRQDATTTRDILMAHEEKLKELTAKMDSLGGGGFSNEPKEQEAVSKANSIEPETTISTEEIKAPKGSRNFELDSIDKLLGLDRFKSSLMYDGKGDL